jgi:heat shock protein HslJ
MDRPRVRASLVGLAPLLLLALTAGGAHAQVTTPPTAGAPTQPTPGGTTVHPLLSRGADLDGDGLRDRIEIHTRPGAEQGYEVWLVVWPGFDLNGPWFAQIGENLQVVDVNVGFAGILTGSAGIQVDLLQLGPDDVPGLPTEWVTTQWTFDTGPPRLVDAVLRGPLSPALLSGSRWRWIGAGAVDTRRELASPVIGATLEFRGEAATGTTGCSRWEGRVLASGYPGELSIAARATGSTQCSRAALLQEDAFIRQLSVTDRVTIQMGRLVLFDSRDPRRRTLFEPANRGWLIPGGAE